MISADNANTYMLKNTITDVEYSLLEMGRAYDVAHLGLSFSALHTSACSTRCTFCCHTPISNPPLRRVRKNTIYIFSNTALFIYAKI
jgi:hypothetical protein